MGDLHQRLTELRRCLDDGLIDQNSYDSACIGVMNFWIANPGVPERSFWQKLYDVADRFMQNIIRPIIERVNRFLIGN